MQNEHCLPDELETKRSTEKVHAETEEEQMGASGREVVVARL